MDRTETLKIMAVLRGAYPGYYRDMGREELAGVAALWQEMFEGEPYELVAAAVKQLIALDTKGFPPVIGQIREQMRRLTQPQAMTEQEAWALVLSAIRRTQFRSRREFDALPPQLQRLVGTPRQLWDWGMSDESVVSSVVASNFQRSYRALAEREREESRLPQGLRRLAKPQDAGTIELR